MTVKEYLKRLQFLDIKINQKVKELDDLRMMSRSVKSADYSKERVQATSSNAASFESSVLRINELESVIDSEIDYFVDLKHTIINQIQSLDNQCYVEILYKRYIEYKRLELVAVEMRYSYDRIKHLHGHALKEFESRHPIAPSNVIQ